MKVSLGRIADTLIDLSKANPRVEVGSENWRVLVQISLENGERYVTLPKGVVQKVKEILKKRLAGVEEEIKEAVRTHVIEMANVLEEEVKKVLEEVRK